VNDTARAAHLNLIDSSRQLFELDSGAALEDEGRWLLGAGRHSHPTITNTAFRRDDAADAGELIARAREFFGERKRGFSVFTRAGEREDEDLAAAAADSGLNPVYEMPEMVCAGRVEQRPLAAGAALRRVETAEQAADYWKVTAAAFVSLQFPPELFGHYDDSEGFLAPNIAAFLGHLDGEPASAAMAIVNNGVAGIYWVGTIEAARGRGLAWATTAAATNAGLELGAEIASLQASHMGEPLYERMGYETLYPYRLFMAPPP
jgi:hypothetical protein